MTTHYLSSSRARGFKGVLSIAWNSVDARLAALEVKARDFVEDSLPAYLHALGNFFILLGAFGLSAAVIFAVMEIWPTQ